MFKISYDKKITMVQGDTGVIRMRIHNYKLSKGDEVRFAIVNKGNPSILLCQHSDKKIVLEKQVTVFEKDGDARILIYPYDTENLQPGKYLYEIQVKTKDGRIDTVVPLASFTLMEGSIQGEYSPSTPSAPESTPSEIELRFKRLEDEIIPELGNRITNVENEIDSVSSSLDNITNNNVVLLHTLKNFSKNDISLLLNNMTFESDKKYILDVGVVRSRSKITLNLPSRCHIELLGRIECEYDFITIKFPTISNGGGSLKIEEVEYIGEPSEKDSRIAVEFKKGANIDIDLGVIKNFGYGLYMMCEDDDEWIQYCNFKFHEISVSQIGIGMYVNTNFNWINENNFFGGGLSGIHNILLEKKGGDGSLINSNRFHDLGVYTNKSEIIYIANDGAEGNSFYNLRLWEQDWTTEYTWIYDAGKSNYFSSKYRIPYYGLRLGNNSIYEGDIHDRYDSVTMSYPLITNKIRINEKGQMNMNRFAEYNEGVSQNGRRKLHKYVETVFCGLADGETLYIDVQPHLTQKGVVFFLRKNGSSNSTVRLELPTGVGVNIRDTGLYRCHMIANDWCEVYKIGSGDGIFPN